METVLHGVARLAMHTPCAHEWLWGGRFIILLVLHSVARKAKSLKRFEFRTSVLGLPMHVTQYQLALGGVRCRLLDLSQQSVCRSNLYSEML
jgi:hypothetical protein